MKNVRMKSKAITQVQTIAILAIVVIAAIAVWYYGFRPSPTPSPSPTPTPSPSPTPTPVVVRVPRSSDIITLDPSICYVTPSIECLTTQYERLIKYSEDFSEFEPVLATSWDVSPDAKNFTFYLRKGVKFHDGTQFNATAVKFTFERMLALQGGPAWMYSSIDRIEVVDTFTAKFILKHPYTPFMDCLAAVFGPFIMSPSYVEAHATNDDPWAQEWMKEHMCGTGPYMLETWMKGQYVNFVRFPEYWRDWEGKHVDNIYMPIIREWSSRRMALEGGELDFFRPGRITIDDLPALMANPNLIVENRTVPVPCSLMLNTLYGPCLDIRVRQALSYLLDYDAVITALGGTATQSQGPVPSTAPAHNDELFMYHYDPEKATELLKEAGYADGLEVTLVYIGTDELERKIAEIFQSKAAASGVTIKLLGLTWPAMWDYINGPPENRPDIIAYVWTPIDYIGPDTFLIPMYKSTEVFAYGYNNTRVDSLLNEATSTVDTSKRVQLYKESQRVIVEDAPAIWVIDLVYFSVRQSWLKGDHFNILYSPGETDFYSLYIEGRP